MYVRGVNLDDDWRLADKEDWPAGREFRWTDWFSDRPGWDHDHCEFCWAESAATATEHAPLAAGWLALDDERTWVCPDCMEDFRVPLKIRTVGP